MKRIKKTMIPAVLPWFALLCLVGGSSWAAETEEPDDALLQMIVNLVSDSDHDMRMLGLQQVREEVPGEAVTKKFAELLPKLSPDGQAGLLEALGDRGDAAARPAVLEMLASPHEKVRAAALGALGMLGTTEDVAMLAQKAAPSELEINAARQSLVRLRGEEVDEKIVATMDAGGRNVRAVLLDVLAARNAAAHIETVLASAQDPDKAVRLAAVSALRYLADENQAAAIVEIVKAAQDAEERQKAVTTLLVVCTRGGEACADMVIAGLEGADAASRIALLRAVARASGSKALEAVAATLQDEDEAVRDEAVRMLSIWPDPAAVSHLQELAKASNPRHQVLALRGMVRLASPREDRPADVKILSEVMELAKRPEEQRLVLGVLGSVANSEALGLAVATMDQPSLADEAGLDAVMIAEKMEDADKDAIKAAMEKVEKLVKNQEVLDRAKAVLKSL